MLTKTRSALVIEQDLGILTGIVHSLARGGVRIASRRSPSGALDYVRRAKPDLVLLGFHFWREGWGIEILDASPETVVIPFSGIPSASWLRETVATALGQDAA